MNVISSEFHHNDLADTSRNIRHFQRYPSQSGPVTLNKGVLLTYFRKSQGKRASTILFSLRDFSAIGSMQKIRLRYANYYVL